MSDLYQPDSALDLLQRFEGNSEARRRYLHERFDRIREFDVRDVAHLAQVLSGRPLAVRDLPVKPIFGVPESYPWGSASVNAASVLNCAVHAIEAAGAKVVPVDFAPWMTEMIGAHATMQSYESFRTLGFEYDHYRGQLTPMLRDFLDRAADVTTDAYIYACAKAETARTALLTWFDGIDALLTPSALDEAPDGLASTGDPAFSRNWTLLGTPCVMCPDSEASGAVRSGYR